MEKKEITPEMIKKAGAMLKDLHERNTELEKLATGRDMEKRAEKLAFREVELGIAEPFKSMEEFQQKVAGLMTENLDVVETALERGYAGAARSGSLAADAGKKVGNPFEHFVQTGELVTE